MNARPLRFAVGFAMTFGLAVSAMAQATKSSTTTTSTSKKAAGKVDLNTATTAELQELPGIGPARAAEIVKARPFKSAADLKALKGFSPALIADLTPRVTVTETTTTKAVSPTGATTKATTKQVMPRSAARPTTRKAAAAEAAREDDPQHLARKKNALAAGRKINVNTATAEELQQLPGIGPARSAAIIKARPFDTIEDIKKVDGIKQGIFGQIKENISVK